MKTFRKKTEPTIIPARIGNKKGRTVWGADEDTGAGDVQGIARARNVRVSKQSDTLQASGEELFSFHLSLLNFEIWILSYESFD